MFNYISRMKCKGLHKAFGVLGRGSSPTFSTVIDSRMVRVPDCDLGI
jgi:hypothetical protein